MHPHETYPWPLLMKVSFQVLGIRPSEFWDMTPVELSLWIKAVCGTSTFQPMSRHELSDMRIRFPD